PLGPRARFAAMRGSERPLTSTREALIDTGAISANVARLKAHSGGGEFIAVVKANGYGHGAAIAARAAIAGGATRLGVADLEAAWERGVTKVLAGWSV